MPLNEISKYLGREARRPKPSFTPLAREKAIAKVCRAIENIRLSRAATQHAIKQSRKSLVETHALLIALRSSLDRNKSAIAARQRVELQKGSAKNGRRRGKAGFVPLG
jgi:hypothetical protein